MWSMDSQEVLVLLHGEQVTAKMLMSFNFLQEGQGGVSLMDRPVAYFYT